ncbi:hypothetical protein EJ110_NYTH05597 [Nymphaea thermarum]|nr:hypothetical protein EJ110_NYTH05597 [Nymphaea thermarum]
MGGGLRSFSTSATIVRRRTFDRLRLRISTSNGGKASVSTLGIGTVIEKRAVHHQFRTTMINFVAVIGTLEYRKNVDAKNLLERYAYKARNEMCNGQRNSIPVATDMKEANDAIEQVIQWLRNAEHAEANEIENKMNKLQGLCDPIIDKMHQRTTTRGVRGAHPHLHDDPSLAPDSSSYGTETDPCLVNKKLFIDNGFGHSSQQLLQPSFNEQPGQTKTSTKSGKNVNQGSSLGDLSESKTGLDNPINKQEGSLDGIVKDQAKVNHEKENQSASLDQLRAFDQKTPGLTKAMPSRSATVDTQSSTLETSSLQVKRDGLMRHIKVHHTEGQPTRHMAPTEKAPTSKEEGRSTY